jgi:hypothetical protein
MDSELLQRVTEEVARLPQPVPLSTLGTLLRKAGVKARNAHIGAALERLEQQGSLLRHPPASKRANAAPRFWGRTPLEYTRAQLEAARTHQPQWTEAALRRQVPQAYRDYFDEALGEMLSAGIMFEVAWGAKRLFTAIHPRPSDFLSPAQLRSLRLVVEHINGARRGPLALEDLLAFLDAEAAPDHAEPKRDGSGGSRGRDRELTETHLVQWYGEDLGKLGGLRSMPIPRTWARYVRWCDERAVAPDADLFHALLDRMHREGKVGLTPHDKPHSVPVEEFAVLRKDEQGRLLYYWTVLS